MRALTDLEQLERIYNDEYEVFIRQFKQVPTEDAMITLFQNIDQIQSLERIINGEPGSVNLVKVDPIRMIVVHKMAEMFLAKELITRLKKEKQEKQSQGL